DRGSVMPPQRGSYTTACPAGDRQQVKEQVDAVTSHERPPPVLIPPAKRPAACRGAPARPRWFAGEGSLWWASLVRQLSPMPFDSSAPCGVFAGSSRAAGR